jgi:hypothetical protein
MKMCAAMLIQREDYVAWQHNAYNVISHNHDNFKSHNV